MDSSLDWRLQGQGKYLANERLQFKLYAERLTNTDHDHCEFCNGKFTDNIDGTFHEGYTTIDNNKWICSNCFKDFKEMFSFSENY